jgi:hypothetical protein
MVYGVRSENMYYEPIFEEITKSIERLMNLKMKGDFLLENSLIVFLLCLLVD